MIRRSLPLASAACLLSTGAFLALQAASPSPRGLLSEPLLPGWARLSLLSLEALALAVVIGLGTVGFAHLEARIAAARGRRRTLLRAVRFSLVLGILYGVAINWGWYWLSGRFLDGGGARFIVRNFSAVTGVCLQLAPVLTLSTPFLLLLVAFLATEGLPAAIRRLPSERATQLVRATTALLTLCFLAAIGGEIVSASSDATVEDPARNAEIPRSEVYSRCRQSSAGPLTHFVLWTSGRGRGDLFADLTPPELLALHRHQTGWAPPKSRRDYLEEGEPDAGHPVARRPILPMAEYLRSVDASALKKYNVVVIVLDSFRADQVVATGGSREVMPALEALAREGRAYPDCYTTASHTDYATPAIFSSHHPLRARWVHKYSKNPTYPRVMVYDVLKALGWRTALFSSQNEDWAGMMDYYQTGALDKVFHPKLPGLPPDLLKTRDKYTGSLDDAVTVDQALAWTEEVPDQPFFLYLNLQNGHLPFRIPPDVPHKFGPATIDFTITGGSFPRGKEAIAKELYADSLAYVDSQIQRVLVRLKERGLWDRTVVVVTGDHGESFYEHDAPAHANGVYEEEVRVPLIFRAPGLEPARDPRPAQLLDVAPGLFHALGLPVHPSFQGIDLLGPPPPADRIRFLVFQTGFNMHLGAVRSGFKLIRESGVRNSMLFDLARDPGEKHDASAEHPEILDDLKAWMKTWRWVQCEYYENVDRHTREYPPRVGEPP